MGVTEKFHKGAWWVFINHRGRRRAKRIGDRQTARRVAREIRERLALGDLDLGPSEDRQQVRAYADRWLESATGSLKASTVAFYRSTLTRYIYPVLGTRRVSSVRRVDCRELIAGCRAKGLAVSTVRGIVRTLSVVLAAAVEDELLPANPALRLGQYLRRGDEPEAAPNPFSREEAELLVAVAAECFPAWHAWVLTGLRTGLRAGEMRGVAVGRRGLAASVSDRDAEYRPQPADDAQESPAAPRGSIPAAPRGVAPMAGGPERGVAPARSGAARVDLPLERGDAAR